MNLLINGQDLSMAEVVDLARSRGGGRTASIAPDAVARMKASLHLKGELMAAGTPIYGVTSGFGDSSTRQIRSDKAADLQANLLRFLNCGTGPLAEPDVVRATLLIRANCLARGYSAVRPEVVELLLRCVGADILPAIPERGSVGASGDLVPLSYVARMLNGEGSVLAADELAPARDALAAAGLAPVTLEAKEGLALVNGTSFMSAFAVLASFDARELVFVAELCTAMASQVLCGNPDHFADFLFRQKPHEGVIASAAAVRRMLGAGDNIDTGGTGDNIGTGGAYDDPGWRDVGYRQLDQAIQDRYSIRCAPHVIGALRDMLGWVDKQLAVEINSSNDNPLFDDESQQVFNGGNFYGSHVGLAMDSFKIAAASVADLLDRQLELVVDEKFNNGLTANLIPRVEPGSWEAGLFHGFKGMQLTASALTAEALHLTTPATSFSRSTEAHNQDKVSMGTIAARDARTVVELAIEVAAVHVLALCQAADLRSVDLLSDRTAALHRFVRKSSPFLDRDRPLDADLATVAQAIRSGELRRAVSD